MWLNYLFTTFGTKEMFFFSVWSNTDLLDGKESLVLDSKNNTLYNTQQMKVITITQILDSPREQVVKFHIIKCKVMLVLFKKIPVQSQCNWDWIYQCILYTADRSPEFLQGSRTPTVQLSAQSLLSCRNLTGCWNIEWNDGFSYKIIPFSAIGAPGNDVQYIIDNEHTTSAL